MTNTNIEALNDVIDNLIDSRKGYEKAADMVKEDPKLFADLRARADARSETIADFHDTVRAMGGDPKTEGSAAGSMHRFWMDVTALFDEDREAALEAIEDGEERLQDLIEDHLKQDDLALPTRELLQRALVQAREGEAFADLMEDAS